MFLGMPPCVFLNEAIRVGSDLFALASGVLNYDIERFAYAGNPSQYRGPATRQAHKYGAAQVTIAVCNRLATNMTCLETVVEKPRGRGHIVRDARAPADGCCNFSWTLAMVMLVPVDEEN
jgi:hypothetical protein